MEIEIDKLDGEIVFKKDGEVIGNLNDALKEGES